VEPVLQGLAAAEPGVQLSIDTSKASVARAAVQAGAAIINDVTALRADPEMAEVCAEAGAEVCLMHMLGDPRTMQDDPRYADVVDDIKAFLSGRIEFAISNGVAEDRIWVDPGIGFGKTVEHNLELLRRLAEFRSLGRPILIGTSRKSFIGKLTGADAGERIGGSVATNVLAWANGGEIFRVHDVAEVRDGLRMAGAIIDPALAERVGDRPIA